MSHTDHAKGVSAEAGMLTRIFLHCSFTVGILASTLLPNTAPFKFEVLNLFYVDISEREQLLEGSRFRRKPSAPVRPLSVGSSVHLAVWKR